MSGYVSHISVNNYSIRVASKENYSKNRWALKIGSAQIGTYNFQNNEIADKHSIYSKQLKLKENKEKYIYLNRYANKSFFLQNFRPLFLTVSPAIVMGFVRN